MGILGVAGAETCVVGDGSMLGRTGGGSSNGTTNSFDGCAWSTENNMGTSVMPYCNGGISSDAIQGAGSQNGASRKFNGTSWSSVTAFAYERGEGRGGDGRPDGALLSGGYGHASGSTNTSIRRYDCHKFDGSSWSTTGNLGSNLTHDYTRYGGNDDGGMHVGGAWVNSNWNGKAYKFDGSSWSQSTDTMDSSLRDDQTIGAGNASAFVAGFGWDGSYYMTCEKFNGTTWSSAGTAGNGHNKGNAGGRGNASTSYNIIVASGQGAGGTSHALGTHCDRYDGSAWAEQANTLYSCEMGGCGFSG